jgi:hypothetical protein
MINKPLQEINPVELIYIIISPITVDEEIPEHHNAHCDRQGDILGQ